MVMKLSSMSFLYSFLKNDQLKLYIQNIVSWLDDFGKARWRILI
jgi:hypothetical protein